MSDDAEAGGRPVSALDLVMHGCGAPGCRGADGFCERCQRDYDNGLRAYRFFETHPEPTPGDFAAEFDLDYKTAEECLPGMHAAYEVIRGPR